MNSPTAAPIPTHTPVLPVPWDGCRPANAGERLGGDIIDLLDAEVIA